MTHYESLALAGRALRPDFYQYFITYTVPWDAGLFIKQVWSCDGIETARQAFLYEFPGAKIKFITCPGSC
ncbi:MAG: hypothetical protein ACRYFX_12730 [Janthinobacterium lividum]